MSVKSPVNWFWYAIDICKPNILIMIGWVLFSPKNTIKATWKENKKKKKKKKKTKQNKTKQNKTKQKQNKTKQKRKEKKK